MDIGSIIGAGGRASFAAAGSAARSVDQLARGNSMQTTNASAQPTGSAALAAGLLAFAAVGVLVTMRVVFRGAVS